MKSLPLASGILGGTLALGIAGWMIWQLQTPDSTGLAREQVVAVGPKTRAALMDAVDQYLETTDPKREKPQVLAALKPELKPRMFCHEDLVEVRQKSENQQLVGLGASCEEYALVGRKLLASSQYKNLALLTVDSTGGRYQVVEIQEALEGDLLRSSVREMFSAEGAPRALEISGSDFAALSEANRVEGRKTFGLPPNAEIEIYKPG
ncbi:hypothetical protein [Streptosporangium carneum]|uniref:Uncharacterized protein n=1 Tax=Streptosporangium carneum TaxID=47481 RepID=A0A9W6MF90_9ACTN|nr:hypothetical protein [Streptosporangium carneum]GLK11638.1 hypothetical protein GCM10017600_50450 [Streptosporangium carneum]